MSDMKRLKKYDPNLTIEENYNALLIPLQRLMDDMYLYKVHENRLQAQREVDELYDSLPLSVIAEMIEEEVTEATAELGL